MKNAPNNDLQKNVYIPVLAKVRTLMISKMTKPEEVLIDEDGSPTRAVMKDTEQISLYAL